jgi:hypothetical protein
MAEGILVGLGLEEADLLAIRDAAIEAFAAGGKQVTAMGMASGNGVQRNKGWALVQDLSPKVVLREVKYALWKLDPEEYADAAPAKGVTYARIRGEL